jgi:type IV pilus assembly protein PilM
MKRSPEEESILTIDLSSQGVKALATTRKGEHYHCQEASAQEFAQKPGVASWGDGIEALKAILGSWKFAQRAVRVAISGDQITVRFIQIPTLTKEQLLANIGYESSKYIPFPLKDMYFDCDVFAPPSGEGNGKATAVIAAVKRDGVGISATLLDISPLALFNAFEVFGNKGPDASTYALLDLGSTRSHIGIVHAGVPCFVRDLEEGEIQFKEAIPKAQNTQPSASTFYAPALQSLSANIRKSLDFFETERGATVKAIYLTGAGSLMPGIADFLQKALGLPATPWNPFENPKIQLSSNAASHKKQGPLFGPCLGLAVREMKG